jgi:hypothetical protein
MPFEWVEWEPRVRSEPDGAEERGTEREVLTIPLDSRAPYSTLALRSTTGTMSKPGSIAGRGSQAVIAAIAARRLHRGLQFSAMPS